MTCMLSLGFIALVMGCVHCCTANVKAKEYETFDTPFLQLDHCDLGLGPRSPRSPRGPRSPRTTRHKADAGWSVLRKLHPTPDADNGNESEEELLFHAPSGPVDSPSLISLHSLQSARERGSSMSMEDLLLLGRCR
ncbi:uncharacterized protein LOC117646038 [Thrips palmi]|uniref:Uncharacterized protein LOC117646038 n=1 Tax=Thrips palmi TaxID=161013 RepID=A0A6P8ZNL7_THRPL|nr:uncharacterized protein LOC117646038 [Thrips palmi]